MSLTLIRGGHVICGVKSRAEAEVIVDGAVLQRDGVVAEVGTWRKLSEKHAGVETLGSAHHVVLPGLVNGHHHVGITPFQLGVPDLPLELWLAERIGVRDVDPHLDTLYSAFEMIESGITTVQHLHGRVAPPLENLVSVASKVIGAYQRIGMRVSYSFGLRDQNRLVYESDEDFAARLPREVAQQFNTWIQSQSVPLEDNFALFESLVKKFAGDERVRFQLSPVNLHWCSDKALELTSEYSQRYDVPMHMHLLETIYQREYARRRTGGSAVEHLHKFKLLGPRMTLGHGVWLTEDEVSLIASTGTGICSNASSNLRLRSGIAPLNMFERRGVRVSMGLDEAGINDDRDMLQEMRLMLKLHRNPGMSNEDVPTAMQVLKMATVNGAMTTPFKTSIGTLQPGKAADLVLIDQRRITRPYLDPAVSIVDAIIHRARPSAVHAVMVSGEVIMRDGHFTNVDKEEVLRELADQLGRPKTEGEMWRDKLSKQLTPHVRDFYSGYCSCESTPRVFYPSVEAQ